MLQKFSEGFRFFFIFYLELSFFIFGLRLVFEVDSMGYEFQISRPEDWEREPDPRKYFVQFFGTQEM